MHIVHGTWIPNATEDFSQAGAFYLWVETDALVGAVADRAAEGLHPRHLVGEALAAWLETTLGLHPAPGIPLSQSLEVKHFLLPSANGAPLPSFELLHYIDEEQPEQWALLPWQIWCCKLPQAISSLNDIHFRVTSGVADLQLGADLLFWHQFTQDLKSLIARDHYIPAIKAHERAVAKGKGKKKDAPVLDLHAGWEWLSDAYEAAIARYTAAMPLVCVAGDAVARDTGTFARESLLRHCAENLLQTIVTATPFTAKFDQQIAGTLLDHSLHPGGRPAWQYSLYAQSGAMTPLTKDTYKQWLEWRQKLTSTQMAAGFNLCIRLEEAPPEDKNNWQIQFLVSPRHTPSLKLALADYWGLNQTAKAEIQRQFGEDFEKHLLLALGTAARIYPKIWDGLDTERPEGIRLNMDEAFAFLQESAWVLEDTGFTVIVPAWWTPQGRRRARLRLMTSARPSKGSTATPSGHLSAENLIQYRYQIAIDGQPVSDAEWQELINARTPLVQFRGQWMELDREKMQQLLAFWQARGADSPELSLPDLLTMAAEAGDDLEWEHDDTVQQMLAALYDKSAFAPLADPQDLQGTLRDYQRRGVSWLQYLEGLGLNPCLADDMGLGKTVQVIARLLNERAESSQIAPTLLVAPTSVLANWRKEIERFAPSLRTYVHQGAHRHKDEKAFKAACQEQDVVVTSYTLARLDEKLLRGVAWHRVVVDEAQNIKNPQSAQTRAILKLKAPHRVALTGTPVENRLRDLWSIFNFLNPGYLGKEAQFRKGFELPIQKENDVTRSQTLKKLVEPFILRRLKTDKRIIDDLPDKIEQKMYCSLTPEQASLYAAVVEDVTAQIDEKEGMERRGLILATLMRLKQICNHPAQFLQDGSAFLPERSHKLERLAEMIEEVIESGDSLLIFTQFTEIGSALERYLRQTLHYNTYYLHGGTSASRREQMVTEFQDPETEPSIFILSLRAGGVGLNLTKASHVFHFDRWWNPAVEDQATDRAFRIGQRKSVFVHKFVTTGTVEERIDALIEDKKRLSSAIVGADESWLTELDNETFKKLIALQQSAIVD